MKRLLPPAVLTAALAVPLAAQSADPIGSIFSDLRPDEPGAAVLVLRNGQTVFERGYGVADLRGRTPIDARTNFRLASCTKAFTALAVMLLVHDGKLRYDSTLRDVFADFPDYGRTVTVRQLLNHTSGLVAYEDVLEKQYAGVPDARIPQIHDAGVLAIIKEQAGTRFPPGSRWEYSNSGYAVLAMVVETISGMAFGDFLHKRIFGPLGMTGSVAYQKGKNEVPRRAFGHSWKEGAWIETDQSSTSAVLGDGGVYAGLDDLAKWVNALDHHTLLGKEAMQQAYAAAAIAGRAPGADAGEERKGKYQDPWDRPNAQYGFGWFLDPFRGRRRIFHDGSTIGGRTSIMRLPDDGLTVIILSNRGNFDPGARAERILDLLLDQRGASTGPR